MANSVVPIRATKVANPKAKPKSTTKTTPKAVPSVFTLRVELAESVPTIWRKIEIDSRATLEVLHHILQAAMGWTDSHLHEFEIAGKRYAKPEEDEYGDFPDTLDEAQFTLKDLVKKGKTFAYLYDFGDGWRHNITVVTATPSSRSICDVGSAWIEDGQRACPPEDCGGIWTYQEFLNDNDEAPDETEALEFRDWVGLDFDPDRFDRKAANAAIARMFWNHWIVIAGKDQ
ncbi:MAG: plasmid pRiA4b ORF-3 family protein [Rhodoferax sp.]|uniref:plasmid pRiA4b ORF-3 family protein n=1 Tax=Rhodoferax sp. TaxID=50421 RepID=UPI001B3FD7F7|nr:plasmid pRiA4b ORF-3 family protein [Rhodoferax sp.]MBP9904505.1 plasmid pRiA4b ORF-3 family protein [Rhodoferax sp.]